MSLHVLRKLRQHGHRAYWVGGCVRDALLGRPIRETDVATSARPDEVLALFPGARRLGERFGVVAVRDAEGLTEIATFRRDVGYSDGRRPDSVTYTDDPEIDVRRRDFTINGILHDPLDDVRLDFVGGAEDIRRRLVRAVGDPLERFREDRLRMLRAVRFAAGLGFEIEPCTLEAIKQAAPGVAAVAPERVRDELGRILTEGGPRRGFELLRETGLLRLLLPEIEALRGVEQPPQFHPEGDVWTHTMLMLDEMRDPSPQLAWGVLLHDVGKPDTYSVTDRIRFHGHVERGVEIAADICSRLRFSNADTDRVVALVRNHMKFMALRQMRPGKLRRFLEQPHIEEHLELHRADCLGSHARLDNYEFAVAALERIAEQGPVQRLLTGDDLKSAGYEPGPLFGKILALVEERRLEGEVSSRDEALALVRERFPPGPSGAPLREHPVDGPGAGAVGPQEQEHEAVQDRELPPVEQGQEPAGSVAHEVGGSHQAGTQERHPASLESR